MDSAMAVPLLLANWERALARCREAQTAPGGSFLELVGEEVLRLYLGGVEPDGDWEGLPPGGGGRAHQAGGAGRDRAPRLDGQDPAGRLGAAVHRF